MPDIADQKSLTNKHVVLILLFLLSVTITATHFVTYNVIASNNVAGLTEREKQTLLNYVDREKDSALEEQKIYLEQQAFNSSILENIKRLNRELDNLTADYHKFKEIIR